jgi:hypothetical protein
MEKPNTLGEASPRFLPKTSVFDKTMLEMDCGDDEDTVRKRWVTDLEALVFDQVNQVEDPCGVVGNGLERLADERLRHGVSETAKPSREQKRMVQEARNGQVEELSEQPRAPELSPLIELVKTVLVEFVGIISVFEWHPAVKLHMPVCNNGIVRPWRPRRRCVWLNSASSVCHCHRPDFANLYGIRNKIKLLPRAIRNAVRH